MKKFLLTLAVMGFMLNGCAWLGFGDDESSTQEVAAATATPDPAPEVTAASSQQSPPKASAKASSRGAKSEAQIKAELDQMGKKLAAQSARTLLPNEAHKEVKQVGNEWVATYLSVDTQNVSTELRPGANGQYVGFIRYQERVMECRGKTRQAALSAPCQQVRTRRLNELIRYDGRQWQD